MTRVFFTDRDLGKQFPAILRNAGIIVERHDDHFPPDTPDDVWLREVGQKRWIVLTHDKRIRYKRNELEAVLSSGVAMLVIIGKAPYHELARSFVATFSRVEAFLDNTSPPFIAKLYRASARELVHDAMAAGRVELWYPR